MAKIRSVKQNKLIVVPYRPARVVALRLFSLMIMGSLLLAAFFVGQNEGFKQQAVISVQLAQTQSLLTQRDTEIADLRQNQVNLERGKTVDESALEEVRLANKSLRDEIAALETEVALYKGIMAPTKSDEGLEIEEFSITTTTSSSRFGFKLVMIQKGNNSTYIDGYVGVNIIGTREGVREVISIKDLSAEVDRVDIRFRYRYFQEVIGELVLPEGFAPYQVHVVAQSTGSKAQRIEKTYNWTDLETLANAG